MTVKEKLAEYCGRINEAMEAALPEHPELSQDAIFEAMRYSLFAGGKRLRPVLCLEFNRLCGGEEADAMPFACAIEMIHTYSLIHDDLPCMDDDDYRRGRLTNHMMYGEDMAVLAGDGLLGHAFETALAPGGSCSADRKLAAAAELARSAGVFGMLGGQVIDVRSGGNLIGLDALAEMHRMKTGALIRGACLMGCITAGAGEKELAAATEYADALGLAFQITDDILDVTGDFEKLGKKTGHDAETGKTTYVSLLGLEEAKQRAAQETERALAALGAFPDSAFLRGLTELLALRDH